VLAPPPADPSAEEEGDTGGKGKAKGKDKDKDKKGGKEKKTAKSKDKKGSESDNPSGWAETDQAADEADEEESDADDESMEAALEAARQGDAVSLAFAVGAGAGYSPGDGSLWAILQPSLPLAVRPWGDPSTDETVVEIGVAFGAGAHDGEGADDGTTLKDGDATAGIAADADADAATLDSQLVPFLPIAVTKAAEDAEDGGQTRRMQRLRRSSDSESDEHDGSHLASAAAVSMFVAAAERAYASGVGASLEAAGLASSAAPAGLSLREAIELEATDRESRARSIESDALEASGLEARRALRFRVHVKLPASASLSAASGNTING